MSEVSELEKVLEAFRRQLLRNERAAASRMVRVYGEAWKRIKAELERLHTEYEGGKARGEKPGEDWIYRYNRARAFRDQVERELLLFAQYAEQSVREQMQEAIRSAEEHAERLTRTALGKPPAGLVVDWNRVPVAAVAEIIGLTQPDSPLHKLFLEISANGVQAAEDALVQGLLMGKNPRETAPLLLKALGATLSRALRIARTETLRAYREATRQNYQANSDVVKGWVWHSALDERTCVMCWVMHGTEHKLTERLDDHPNGRCAMVPKTATWEEICSLYGIDLSDVPDTNPQIEPGVSVFDRLPAEKQIKILGPAKFAAWKEGQFTLSDLVGRIRSIIWGTHRYEKSLQDLMGKKAKDYIRLALTGAAQRAGNYTVDDLIRIAGIGLRELTPGELERVARHVATVGFSTTEMMRVRTSIRGQVWNGKRLEIGDMIPTDVGHYLKHVVVNQEWPDGTTLGDYKRSLREVILDPSSDVFVSKYNDAWQIGFIRESRNWRGTNGYGSILVEYKVQYGYLVTGYQPEDVVIQLAKDRESFQWIRKKRFH